MIINRWRELAVFCCETNPQKLGVKNIHPSGVSSISDIKESEPSYAEEIEKYEIY